MPEKRVGRREQDEMCRWRVTAGECVGRSVWICLTVLLFALCPPLSCRGRARYEGGKAGKASAEWGAMLARDDVYGENQQFNDKRRHANEDEESDSASEQYSVGQYLQLAIAL